MYPFEIIVFECKVLPMKRFDIRKVRKLAARERYSELYFHWSRAEQMIASNFPGGQRSGRRLKKRIENLYEEWFGAMAVNTYAPNISALVSG
jgi:hypothetical protein